MLYIFSIAKLFVLSSKTSIIYYMNKIPTNLQGVLWSIPLSKIDLVRDKVYLIHQILMYGDFKNIKWLLNIYDEEEISEVFIKKPQQVYTPQAFNYVKNFVLNLNNKNISPVKYVNTIHKHSKQ